jgi:hypothetical protein
MEQWNTNHRRRHHRDPLEDHQCWLATLRTKLVALELMVSSYNAACVQTAELAVGPSLPLAD